MKPGDLVITVSAPDDPLDPLDCGLVGVIVEPTALEDGHPINSWCDWWVLMGGGLIPWAKEHLRVVNETDGCYDGNKEKHMSNDAPPTSSFPVTDPDIIARLDSLSPEEMERLSSILEDSLKELRKERDGE